MRNQLLRYILLELNGNIWQNNISRMDLPFKNSARQSTRESDVTIFEPGNRRMRLSIYGEVVKIVRV